MTTAFSLQVISDIGIGAALASIMVLSIIWYLSDLKETSTQIRLCSYLSIFIVPLLIMFAYVVIYRIIKIL